MPFTDLPNELLAQICLLIREVSFHDLASLSRANRICFSIAAPIYYRKLSVHWAETDKDGVETAVAELSHDGLGRQYLKYSRDLDIICHTGLPRTIPLSTQNVPLMLGNDSTETNNATFLKAQLIAPWTENPAHWIGHCEMSRDWKKLLVSLLTEFEHLRQLNYYTNTTFPLCFLDAIAKYQPFCKLHIWGNQFVRYKHCLPFYARLRSYERAPLSLDVLSSSQLETFTLYYPWRRVNGGGFPPDVYDEYFSLLTQTPNLKHLRLWGDATLEELSAWQDKEPDPASGNPKLGSAPLLVSLAINGGYRVPSERILVDMSCTFDLSRLRSLTICQTRDSILVEKVAPSLHIIERLSITRHPELPLKDLHELRGDRQVVAAVRAFRPLRYLRMQVIDSVDALHSILRVHGYSLRGLDIQPFATAFASEDDFDTGYQFPRYDGHGLCQLADLCLNIEELRLQVQRSMGSPDECEIYKALGALHSLQTLFLDLHCEPRQVPFQRATDMPYREILVNAAIDKALVLAIWELIYSRQRTKALQNLRITPFGNDFFFEKINFALRMLCNSFVVKRIGSPFSNTVKATRVEPKYDDIDEEESDEGINYWADRVELAICAALDDLWPGSELPEGPWHSFPLQSEDPNVL